MKIDIIICYMQRYIKGHAMDFVPPITGIHLAAITPPEHRVRVYHQQVEDINLETDADLIAISFFSGFAPMAYQLARAFKLKSKIVVAGGPHVTYNKQEALQFFDSIIVGEAENEWPKMLKDIEKGTFARVYNGKANSLEKLPTPRYDLIPKRYFIKKVIQATRGCYYKCSFCSVPSLNPGYRVRPVEHVLQDAKYNQFKYWWQRKVVWFWDDNLLINRKYAYKLLEGMIPLKKWWLTQASIDISKDEKLLKLLKASGCIGIFIGIESFSKEALEDANKIQNKFQDYKSAIKKLHKFGICAMAGLITGFPSDTEESILKMLDHMKSLAIDVPFISILTPFSGTPLFNEMKSNDLLIKQRGWRYYNGYNVTFHHPNMSSDSLLRAHRRLWKRSFSFWNSLYRIVRGAFYLRPGAWLMSLFMNSFYGMKGIVGNLPKDMSTYTILNIGDQSKYSQNNPKLRAL